MDEEFRLRNVLSVLRRTESAPIIEPPVLDNVEPFKLRGALELLRGKQGSEATVANNLVVSPEPIAHTEEPRPILNTLKATPLQLDTTPLVAAYPFNSDLITECSECLQCIPRLWRAALHLCRRCCDCIKVLSLEQEALLDKELREGVILPEYARTIDSTFMSSTLAQYPTNAICAINVRKADPLRPHPLLLHPVIRVHIVDLCTGRYIRKSDKSKSVVLPFENVHRLGSSHSDKTEFILPLQTKSTNLRAIGGFSPTWGEELIVNELLEYLATPNTILLFELLDFGAHIDLKKYPDGCFRLAWAFLKVISTTGRPNFGENLKLQLYSYTSRSDSTSSLHAAATAFSYSSLSRITRPDVPDVYFDWVFQRTAGRFAYRYPSSLCVALHGIAPLQKTITTQRPTLPTQVEVGRIPFEEMAKVLGADGRVIEPRELDSGASRRARARQRGVSESCVIPQTPLFKISAGKNGCTALSFSPSGNLLAAACAEQLVVTIRLFATDSGQLRHTFVGHHDIVYELCWSETETELLSASSDHTAKIWDVKHCNLHAIQSFQHTNFVYSALYLPKSSAPIVVVTGGFDGCLRLWNRENGHLLASYAGAHSSHINSVAVNATGTTLLSGDSNGTILVWEDSQSIYSVQTQHRTIDIDTKCTDWDSRFTVVRTIDHPELRGCPINCLRYHSFPEVLSVYTRNNAVFVFALRRFELRKKLVGVQCRSARLCCSISPDGRMVVAGSEDGSAVVWDIQTGKIQVCDMQLNVWCSLANCGAQTVLSTHLAAPVFDIAWHPHEHLVALASFGGDFPILLLDN